MRHLQPENHVILGEIPHFPRKVSIIDSANGFVSKYSVYIIHAYMAHCIHKNAP